MLVFDTRPHLPQGPQSAKGTYDWPLFMVILALLALGVTMVASSSVAMPTARANMGQFYYLERHLAYLLLGLAFAFIALRLELRWFQKHPLLLMVFGLLLLTAVFMPLIGTRVNGAYRWLKLGPLSFQPVEAVKLIVIFYIASYLVRHKRRVESDFWGTFNPLAVALLVGVILLRQPDFGSASLIIAVTLGMIWLGGARTRNLLILASLLAPIAAWLSVSQNYRLRRLTSFLNPWDDPFNSGFQLVQALIAIGRGEWFGVGLGASVQKLFYLPEAHTDFILAVIGEELGFVGIMTVLGLFAMLVWRGFRIGIQGVRCNQHFIGYVAMGISLMLGVQAMVSVGVNLGVLPTKGITLPFISFGGSSLLMSCIMSGVLLRCGYEVTRAQANRATRAGKFKREQEAQEVTA